MNPVRPVLRSRTWVSSAPALLLSKIWILSRSPGFIRSVCRFGVAVLRLARSGLGGPVGMPFVWRKAKLIGSVHLLLQTPDTVHSSESIVRATHQCLPSQLRASANGANPGG